MAPLLLAGGTLVTLGSVNRLLSNGALLLDGGLIAAIGKAAALRAAHPGAEVIDARGGYIMPGMICTHTHTYGAFARGMALKDPPPRDFVQILERLWWRLDRALTPDDIAYSALVCLVDAIRHGTTTLIDHHASPNACDGSLDIIAEAFRQAGLRGSLCYEVSDREGRDKTLAGIRENERFIRRLRGGTPGGGQESGHSGSSQPPTPPQGEGTPPTPSPRRGEGWGEGSISSQSPTPSEEAGWGEGRLQGRPPLLAGMMGLHAAFTLSDDTISRAVGVAHNRGVGCQIHVAEGDADGRDSREKYHLRTIERLARLGVLGPQSIAAHCIHIDEHEMQILAGTGTIVVHNPRSNMNNAVGTARLSEMLKHGILVGLGNDGFSNDMFVEMKAAYLSHKAASGDPRAMPADVVQRLAIANNARIASTVFGGPGSDLRFGELAAGAPADVIVVDYHSPTPVTADNLPWHTIFGIDGGMVTTTIANGRILMRDRQLCDLDEEEIFARARELAAALWDRF